MLVDIEVLAALRCGVQERLWVQFAAEMLSEEIVVKILYKTRGSHLLNNRFTPLRLPPQNNNNNILDTSS